jgi:hypothetical protein
MDADLLVVFAAGFVTGCWAWSDRVAARRSRKEKVRDSL